jgi:hypothetical protein
MGFKECMREVSGAVLSTESSVLSRNFPVTAKNNRELKGDLARNR